MSTQTQGDDARLTHLQRQRAVVLANLKRALSTWKLSPTARAFAIERLDRLLNDDALRAMLVEADSAGAWPISLLCECLLCEVICMWMLVGRGFDEPERLAATVRGITPLPQLH
jgi:hypothetical protein